MFRSQFFQAATEISFDYLPFAEVNEWCDVPITSYESDGTLVGDQDIPNVVVGAIDDDGVTPLPDTFMRLRGGTRA